MASNIASRGGYECDFVETPPDELLCLICTFVAREPMQMKCCGKVCCKACLTEHKKRSNKCPQCKKQGNDFRDRRGKFCSCKDALRHRVTVQVRGKSRP